MRIKIKENKVRSLELKAASDRFSEIIDNDDDKYSLDVSVDFQENDFLVSFIIGLTLSDGANLSVTFDSKFEADEPIDDAFKSSHFPYVNAPAIAFPFLRVFVSNLTLNCGYKTVLLPSINFSALYKNKLADQ